MKYKFPKDFLWGVAMSGYQVEGNGVNTDWWAYENAKKITQKYPEEKSGIANDFWNRYEEDIDLASSLGINSIRLGVEWARIEPIMGKFDNEAIFHYKKILKYAKSKKLKIFLTLNHFTLPLWFAEMGGFSRWDAKDFFLKYSLKAVEEFKDYVDFFITINEPSVYSLMGYVRGSWPPNKKNKILAAFVHINQLMIHRYLYSKIKEKYSVKIGIVKNIVWYEGKRDSFLDDLNSKIVFFFNFQFSILPIINKTDFIGLNYYFSNQIENFKVNNPCDPESDMGWWISFEGLNKILIALRKYNKDIYITENGLADASDDKRKWFIKNMLISSHEALESHNVRLKGYLHWTLTDNYEWHHGYWPQFGLIKIKRDKTLKRIKRESFNYYKSICQSGIVEDNI